MSCVQKGDKTKLFEQNILNDAIYLSHDSGYFERKLNKEGHGDTDADSLTRAVMQQPLGVQNVTDRWTNRPTRERV